MQEKKDHGRVLSREGQTTETKAPPGEQPHLGPCQRAECIGMAIGPTGLCQRCFDEWSNPPKLSEEERDYRAERTMLRGWDPALPGSHRTVNVTLSIEGTALRIVDVDTYSGAPGPASPSDADPAKT